MDPRRYRFARRVVTTAVSVFLLAPPAAVAQSYQILHTFTINTGDGAQPFAALIQGSDGKFYGTTGNGGTNNVGTVFKMDAAGNVTILHSFVTTDGYGVWVLANGNTWTPLHSLHPTTIVTADLDSNGRDEIVFDFPGYGLWVYSDSGTWRMLNSLSASHMAAGHLDANAKADLVIDFGAGIGIWVYRNNVTWSYLNGFPSKNLLLADLDGTGKDEVVVDFGPAYGLWQYANDNAWSRLNAISPAGMAAGRFY